MSEISHSDWPTDGWEMDHEKWALARINAALLERVTVLEKALESVRDAASGPWAEPSETARRVIAEIAQKALDA